MHSKKRRSIFGDAHSQTPVLKGSDYGLVVPQPFLGFDGESRTTINPASSVKPEETKKLPISSKGSPFDMLSNWFGRNDQIRQTQSTALHNEKPTNPRIAIPVLASPTTLSSQVLEFETHQPSVIVKPLTPESSTSFDLLHTSPSPPASSVLASPTQMPVTRALSLPPVDNEQEQTSSWMCPVSILPDTVTTVIQDAIIASLLYDDHSFTESQINCAKTAIQKVHFSVIENKDDSFRSSFAFEPENEIDWMSYMDSYTNEYTLGFIANQTPKMKSRRESLFQDAKNEQETNENDELKAKEELIVLSNYAETELKELFRLLDKCLSIVTPEHDCKSKGIHKVKQEGLSFTGEKFSGFFSLDGYKMNVEAKFQSQSKGKSNEESQLIDCIQLKETRTLLNRSYEALTLYKEKNENLSQVTQTNFLINELFSALQIATHCFEEIQELFVQDSLYAFPQSTEQIIELNSMDFILISPFIRDDFEVVVSYHENSIQWKKSAKMLFKKKSSLLGKFKKSSYSKLFKTTSHEFEHCRVTELFHSAVHLVLPSLTELRSLLSDARVLIDLIAAKLACFVHPNGYNSQLWEENS